MFRNKKKAKLKFKIEFNRFFIFEVGQMKNSPNSYFPDESLSDDDENCRRRLTRKAFVVSELFVV